MKSYLFPICKECNGHGKKVMAIVGYGGFVIKNNIEIITIGRGYDAYIGTFKIMGNIHENSELLK